MGYYNVPNLLKYFRYFRNTLDKQSSVSNCEIYLKTVLQSKQVKQILEISNMSFVEMDLHTSRVPEVVCS